MDNPDTTYPALDAPKKAVPDQNWKAANSTRFDTYEAARAAYDASSEERKRVRARTNGKFDFVVYSRVPKPKDKAE